MFPFYSEIWGCVLYLQKETILSSKQPWLRPPSPEDLCKNRNGHLFFGPGGNLAKEGLAWPEVLILGVKEETGNCILTPCYLRERIKVLFRPTSCLGWPAIGQSRPRVPSCVLLPAFCRDPDLDLWV